MMKLPQSPYKGRLNRIVPETTKRRASREHVINWNLDLWDRHYGWRQGFECADLDYPVIEYSGYTEESRVVGFIEYKSEKAKLNLQASTIRALANAGDRADIPAFVVVVARDYSWWEVHCANSVAHSLFASRSFVSPLKLTEEQYKHFLLYLRRDDLNAPWLAVVMNTMDSLEFDAIAGAFYASGLSEQLAA